MGGGGGGGRKWQNSVHVVEWSQFWYEDTINSSTTLESKIAQILIALLLIPPESNGINEKVSNQIIKWWTQTLEEYPSEGRKLAILFLPWLHKLSCDNVDFQIYMKLYQQ